MTSPTLPHHAPRNSALSPREAPGGSAPAGGQPSQLTYMRVSEPPARMGDGAVGLSSRRIVATFSEVPRSRPEQRPRRQLIRLAEPCLQANGPCDESSPVRVSNLHAAAPVLRSPQ